MQENTKIMLLLYANTKICLCEKLFIMKKSIKILSIIFLFQIITLNLFAKPAKMPDWVQNYRKVYPDSEYLCQRGSGKSAEEAKIKATADEANELASYLM